MATMIPPQKGVEYIFYPDLISQANAKKFQVNPTLAAGDVLVSTDGGATSNLDTLPAVTPAGGTSVKVTVSAAEMNGDNIKITFRDVAGDEWCDLSFGIQTAAQSLDAMDTNIDAIKVKTDNQPSGVPKNVALSNFEFLMVLSSDHITPATGKTVTAQISKDGGAFANCTNAVAEVGTGVYKIDLTQAEMNADILTLKFTEGTCDQRTVTILTSA